MSLSHQHPSLKSRFLRFIIFSTVIFLCGAYFVYRMHMEEFGAFWKSWGTRSQEVPECRRLHFDASKHHKNRQESLSSSPGIGTWFHAMKDATWGKSPSKLSELVREHVYEPRKCEIVSFWLPLYQLMCHVNIPSWIPFVEKLKTQCHSILAVTDRLSLKNIVRMMDWGEKWWEEGRWENTLREGVGNFMKRLKKEFPKM